MSSIAITSACHCGANSFPISLPASSTPQLTDFCHCTSCRRSTGSPFNTFIELASSPFSDSALPSTLRSYKSSKTGTRYFCTTCGAHMAMDYTDKAFYIATGTLSSIEGVYELSWHAWLRDTGDGGISRLIDDKLPRFAIGKDDGEYFELPVEPLARSTQEKEDDNDVLRASCRCKAIRLTITRPLTNPFGPAVAIKATPDRRRWRGGSCFCASCRLTSGFPMADFIHVGSEHLKIEDQDGKLVKYKSSPPVTRTFCGTCGATVTYEEESSPWVDVATGLVEVDVEKGEGVRGVEEDWWVYDEQVDFWEEGRETGLVEAMRQGLRIMKKRE